MATFSKFTILFFTLTIISFFTFSCNKEKEKKLNIKFLYKINNNEFNYNETYTINGVAIKISNLKMYISDINIEDDALRTESFPNKYLLVSPENSSNEIGMVTNSEIDHLHHIRFKLGIDSVTNNQTAAQFAARTAPDPLSVQSPPMHFAGGNGYIFLRIDAMVDTDTDGIPETAAEFHIGGDNYLQTYDFIAHKDLVCGENNFNIKFNIAKIFDGVDLASEFITHTDDYPLIADKIKLNLPAAFTLSN